MICLYAKGNGVIAHAKVSSELENKPDQQYAILRYQIGLEDAKVYLGNPLAIDAILRSKLQAFEGKDPNRSWAWFVRATRKISPHDFDMLTRC